MRAAGPSLRRLVVIGVLLLSFVLGGSAPVWAQLAVEPSDLAVTVPQGEAILQTVTLTNVGEEPLAYCLSFDRPLQRTGGEARLSEGVLGSACGSYGEVLALVTDEILPEGGRWDPYGLTTTPDGRLFVADYNDARGRTHELTPELQHVRSFEHPIVRELEANPVTTGVAYNPNTGTLWWLNKESKGFEVHRALLLEGNLNGVATGRRIELPVGGPDVPPDERLSPVGLAYDPARSWYYYTDIRSETVWAVDTLGNLAPGYPIQPDAYPGATLAFGLDAHPSEAGTDAESVRLDLYVRPPGEPRRIAVVDHLGGDLGAGTSLETPLPFQDPNTETGLSSGEPVRSRLDPNGVLYYPFSNFDEEGVLAIRPHPLPPSWLVVDSDAGPEAAWDGTLAPGASREVTLKFRAGARTLGHYTAVLQAFTASTGEVVEVPLALTVTQGTNAEEPTAALEASSLSVYPNPTRVSATVEISLRDSGDVRVVVYDVLGREVAMLYEGRLTAGQHNLYLDAARLPAGVNLIRVEGDEEQLTVPITLLK